MLGQCLVDLCRLGGDESFFADFDVAGDGLQGVLLVLDDLDGLQVVLSLLDGRHLVVAVLEAGAPRLVHVGVRLVDFVRDGVVSRHNLGNLTIRKLLPFLKNLFLIGIFGRRKPFY